MDSPIKMMWRNEKQARHISYDILYMYIHGIIGFPEHHAISLFLADWDPNEMVDIQGSLFS